MLIITPHVSVFSGGGNNYTVRTGLARRNRHGTPSQPIALGIFYMFCELILKNE
jgi:hypothetical protein